MTTVTRMAALEAMQNDKSYEDGSWDTSNACDCWHLQRIGRWGSIPLANGVGNAQHGSNNALCIYLYCICRPLLLLHFFSFSSATHKQIPFQSCLKAAMALRTPARRTCQAFRLACRMALVLSTCAGLLRGQVESYQGEAQKHHVLAPC